MNDNLKNIQELTFILTEIKNKIFLPLKFAIVDFEYLFDYNKDENAFYLRKYAYSSSRLQFYTGFFIILHINKLFNKEEETSLTKLLEDMKDIYNDSDWKNKISLNDLNNYFEKIKSKEIRDQFKKVLTTRHKFYAHLDKDNLCIDFSKIKLRINEMKMFIDLAEFIFKDLNLKLWNVDTTFDISKGELGNVYIEELKEFSKLKYEKMHSNQHGI